MNHSSVQSFLWGSMNDSLEPPISLKFKKQVLYVEFSPFEDSHGLVAVILDTDIIIASVIFQEEDDSQLEPVKFNVLQTIDQSQFHRVCWSPESSLKSAPYNLVFACTKYIGYSIHTFRSNINDEYSEQILIKHANYVNDIAYEPSGECFASVSDDMTCRIWEVNNNYEQNITFYLLSPGMSVVWHKTNAGILLVGEKVGTVRLYNVTRGIAVLCMQSSLGMLSDVAWLSSDTNYIAALCASNIVVWRMSSPSIPYKSESVHPDGGRCLAFIPGAALKIISLGAPGNSMKVTSLDKNVSTTLSSFKLATNLSTHATMPYIAIGVDNTVQLWNTTIL